MQLLKSKVDTFSHGRKRQNYKRVKGCKEIILDVKRFLPEELIINGLFIPKFVNSVGKTPMVLTPKNIFLGS